MLAGHPAEALAAAAKVPGTVYDLELRAMAERSVGHEAASHQATDEMVAKYNTPAAYQIAKIYAWRGQKDKAFAWLDRAFAPHDTGFVLFVLDPLIDPLREDPRFVALKRRLHFPT